jgi:ACS family glucarate transporter-like MFS transporter
MSERAATNVRWFLVFWLFVLSSIAFLDRVNISIAGSAIASDYALSNVQLGRVFSAFLLGYTLFQTAGGWLADRLGSRRVLFVGVVWWGVFTGLTAAVSPKIGHAIWYFVFMRFLLGAGEAVIYPASNQFVSRWIPTQERGIANGLIFAGVGVGAGIAPTLITYVMLHYGWRSSFWISALLGLLAGAAWFLAARDTPEEHARVSSSELRHIQMGRTVPSVQPEKSSLEERISWGAILRSKNVWAITVSYFCFGYVAWIFFSWFYIYLAKVRGLDLKASAIYSTLPPLAMVACSLLGGVVSDRLTKLYGKRAGRCGIAVFALTLAAVFLVSGSHVQSARVASVVLAGGAGSLYLSQSSFWSVSADIGAGSSGSVSGFMNTGAQAGGFLTALLTPIIAAHFGWTTSFSATAVLSAVGAIAWLFVNPEQSLAAAGLESAVPRKSRLR